MSPQKHAEHELERREKLEKLAEVLMLAASKARELSDTGKHNGRISRETALSRQIEHIAARFREIAVTDGAPLP